MPKLIVYFIAAMVGDLLLLLACGYAFVLGSFTQMQTDKCQPGDGGVCSTWPAVMLILMLLPVAILVVAVILTWRKPKAPDVVYLPKIWAPFAGLLALVPVLLIADLLAGGQVL